MVRADNADVKMALLSVVAGEEGLFVVGKGAGEKGGADLVYYVNDKMLVMNTGEDFGGDFVGFEEVMEVGFVVIFTTSTITF